MVVLRPHGLPGETGNEKEASSPGTITSVEVISASEAVQETLSSVAVGVSSALAAETDMETAIGAFSSRNSKTREDEKK